MVLTWRTGVKQWSPACRCIGCANQAPDAAEPDKPQKAARLAPAAEEPLSAPGMRAAPARAQAAVGEAASFGVQRLEQRRAAAAAPPAAEWWPARKPMRATPPAERFLLPEAYMLKGAAKGIDGEHVWPHCLTISLNSEPACPACPLLCHICGRTKIHKQSLHEHALGQRKDLQV